MKKTGSVLITTVYHIKSGFDRKFVKTWNDRVAPITYRFGSDRTGLYHNENTDEFISLSHWDNIEDANAFLNSDEFKECFDSLNECCLIPLNRRMHDIFYEKIA